MKKTSRPARVRECGSIFRPQLHARTRCRDHFSLRSLLQWNAISHRFHLYDSVSHLFSILARRETVVGIAHCTDKETVGVLHRTKRDYLYGT